MQEDTTMAIPVAGVAGDDLALGDGDLRAAEQLHRRQVSEEATGKDSLLSVIAPVAGVLAMLLALAEVLLDWTTQISLNVSILYGLPLVVAVATRSRRLLWGLALFLLITIFAVYYVQIPPGVFSFREPYFINRVLAAFALVLTAALLHVGLIGLDLLEAQRRSLKEQNEELERRRHEAEEASSRKTRFLASVSHDIRTPLQSITLMADILCRAAEKPDLTTQIPDVAHRLQANARALADLVGDVLDLDRFDAAQGKLQTTEFSLNDLLGEEAALVRPLAEAKGLWLKLEMPEVTFRLRSDRMKLVRIMANLLGNAIKYTNGGGVTLAASREPDGSALIRVSDTGVGIAQEQMEHIFEEFVQLHNSERDRSKGHGLGLAICRRLVEALGGRITLESQPGRGSRFTVRLRPSCVVDTPGGVPPPPTCRET
jgi:signal transduction histidine kinase